MKIYYTCYIESVKFFFNYNTVFIIFFKNFKLLKCIKCCKIFIKER